MSRFSGHGGQRSAPDAGLGRPAAGRSGDRAASKAQCAGPAEVAEAAGDADVVWTMGGSRVITAEVLPLLRRCRVILRTGTGTDNIPVEAATRLGIVVANTPEATMHQVAEHAIGLLFAVIRRIAEQDRLVRRGIWDRYRAWPDWHLVGRTLGLVGFGRIARLVARKVSGLELKVIASDPVVGRRADGRTRRREGEPR